MSATGLPGGAKPPLRACMVSYFFWPNYSGSAIQARRLCHALRERGVEVQIVSANLAGAPSREIIDGGIPLTRLRVGGNAALQVPFFLIRLFWFLIRHRGSYDVVHAHGTFQHVTASLAARLMGRKSLLKVAMANSDIAFDGQGRLWGSFNRFCVRRFSGFIAISKIIQREFLDRGIPRERIHFLPNGVDTDVCRPAADVAERRATRATLGLPERRTIAFVGIVNPRKNVDLALRVLRDVVAGGIDAQLVVVGPLPAPEEGDWRYFQSLQAFAAEHRLTERLKFAGQQPNVAEYLRAADLFLFPSKQEGMPNALLEAMAAGLPCVASRISGSEDLIDDGRTGYLIALDDEPAFSTRVAGLLADDGQAQRVGSAARSFIEASFSLRSLAANYEKIYRELVVD
jgi:glycosyltransferase involved in cell wall biosynthesis